MNNKLIYEAPKAQIIAVEASDMLSTSGSFTDPDIVTGGWVEI